MSQAWATRPSALLDLQDGWTAYRFDEAVLLFAGEVQHRLDKAEAAALSQKGGKPGAAVQRALEAALGIEPSRGAGARPSVQGRRYEYDLSGAEPVARLVSA